MLRGLSEAPPKTKDIAKLEEMLQITVKTQSTVDRDVKEFQ